MAANTDLFENYKTLSAEEKINFLLKIFTEDEASSKNIIRKNIYLIQEILCSDDVVICPGHLKFITKELQYICSGCHEQYCLTCMYETVNNTKLNGWYCCRNAECQKLYDADSFLS